MKTKVIISALIAILTLLTIGCGGGGGNTGKSGYSLSNGGSGLNGSGGDLILYKHHWQGAQKLVAPNYSNKNIYQIKVAINENGKAIAVFNTPLPSEKVNLSSSFYDGHNWKSEKNIGDYEYFSGVGYSYNIALDSNNIAYLLATNYNSNIGNTKLYKLTFNNNQWSPANSIVNTDRIIDINFKINSEKKNLANIVVRTNNSNYIIDYKLNQNQFNPIYHTNLYIDNLTSCISKEGNKKIVAFSEYDSNLNKQYIKVSTYNGNNWSNPVKISELNINFTIERIGVAIDKNGNALIAWAEENSLGDVIVKAKYKEANSTWQQNATVVAFQSGFNFNFPTLAMSDNKAIVVMEKRRVFPSVYEIWACIFDKATKQWGNLEKISTASNAIVPVIASGKNDIFIVAWSEKSSSDGDNYIDLATKIYNNGWSNVKYIEDVNSKDITNFPDIDMNNKGEAVVGWLQEDTTGKIRAYVNIFR